MTMNTTKRKNLNIGALWLSETRAGDDYLSGHITLPDGQTLDITAFKNRYKTPDNRKPEYVIWTQDRSDLPPQDTEPVEHPF